MSFMPYGFTGFLTFNKLWACLVTNHLHCSSIQKWFLQKQLQRAISCAENAIGLLVSWATLAYLSSVSDLHHLIIPRRRIYRWPHCGPHGRSPALKRWWTSDQFCQKELGKWSFRCSRDSMFFSLRCSSSSWPFSLLVLMLVWHMDL